MTESTDIETDAALDEESDSQDTYEDNDDQESSEGGEAADSAEPRPRKRRRKRSRSGAAGSSTRDGENSDYAPEDEQAAKALDFITDVVKQMHMTCKVQLRPPKDDEDRDIRLEISGPDAGRIIGKKGQVLGALQFLGNRVLNRPGVERRYVTVDAEGYRSRRDDSLSTMAQRLGKQAVTDGKIITFEPMSPRDRRVVHLALAKFEGVVTRSEGEGDERCVQIIPVRKSS